MDIQLPS